MKLQETFNLVWPFRICSLEVCYREQERFYLPECCQQSVISECFSTSSLQSPSTSLKLLMKVPFIDDLCLCPNVNGIPSVLEWKGHRLTEGQHQTARSDTFQPFAESVTITTYRLKVLKTGFCLLNSTWLVAEKRFFFSYFAVRERTVKIAKGTGNYPWGFRIQFSKPILVTEVDTSRFGLY